MKNVVRGLLGLSMLGAATVASAASIQINPASQTVTVGDSISVSVDAATFPVTFGGGVRVTWDPTVLALVTTPAQVSSALVAPATGRGAWDLQAVSVNAAGWLEASMSCFFFCNGYGGDFNLFGLSFTTLQPSASTTLALGPRLNGAQQPIDQFIDPNAVTLTYDLISANVTINPAVGAVPLPGAVWLFLSGLIGVVGAGRRRAAA